MSARVDPTDPTRGLREARSPRLAAERWSEVPRVAAGRMLIGGGSMLLTAVGRSGHLGAVHRLERRWGRAAERLLRLDVEASGLEFVDPAERYVIVALHDGFADALALLRLPLGLRFAVRDELFGWPTLGRYLRSTHQVRVDEAPTRGSLRRLLRDAGSMFSDGDSLVVFAQGSILGLEVAFQPGAFRIAAMFGRPILPVVLTGSHRVWEWPYSPKVRFGQRITMRVLPPLSPGQRVGASDRGLERSMKELALRPDVAPARRFVPERDGWWDGYRYEVDPDFPELARRLALRRAGEP